MMMMTIIQTIRTMTNIDDKDDECSVVLCAVFGYPLCRFPEKQVHGNLCGARPQLQAATDLWTRAAAEGHDPAAASRSDYLTRI